MTPKILLSLFLVIAFGQNGFTQTITNNRNPVGLEHNLLFNATTRYTVSQSGNAKFSLTRLFDGIFIPSYTLTAPSVSSPTVILITGLPKRHIQAGAWVGWSTRYWPASRFKIEGFDEYYNRGWTVIADYQNRDYTGTEFIKKCPGGTYTKLRFTFYKATGTNGRLGVSELYFIHPEATQPYAGLYAPNAWVKKSANLYYKRGNVGIGTENPEAKLTVAGKIRSREVEVMINAGADFVFDNNYPIKTIEELDTFIKKHKHLPEVPSAKEMEKNGIDLGEMNIILLQKIEELTLYIIDQNKKIIKLEGDISKLKKKNEK